MDEITTKKTEFLKALPMCIVRCTADTKLF